MDTDDKRKAVEAALSQIEDDALKTLRASWDDARRDHKTTAKKTARAAGEKPGKKKYRRFPTNIDELLQGPWMQHLEKRVRDGLQTNADVRVLRAFTALALVRETRQHLADGHAHQAVLTVVDAMLNTSMATDSDLFRRPRIKGSITTNRKRRENARARQEAARSLASVLKDENEPREIPALIARRLGVSAKTARRDLC